MKKWWIAGMVMLAAAMAVAQDAAPAPAPDFTLKDTAGREVSLSAFKGKIVVLEWFNPDCPFVRKHYDSGNMQALQKEYTEKGIVWLSICSSAPGKQGHYPAAKHNELMKEKGAAPTAVLLDEDGRVGKLYGAKTTPHMFIIAADGKLAYQGAIDDKTGTDKEEIKTAANYVRQALDALLAGQAPAVAATKPYGCSVKY